MLLNDRGPTINVDLTTHKIGNWYVIIGIFWSPFHIC